MAKHDSIGKFFFELGALRYVKRSGFVLAGCPTPDSIADHIMRAAIIGMVLADLEGADTQKVATMVLIHDIPESRIGDHHKVNARYINKKPAERRAFAEQLTRLPKPLADRWKRLYEEFERRNTLEGIVAKDADWLEVACTSREWEVLGYTVFRRWIDNVRKALETESAKLILEIIAASQPTDWWKGIDKMTYRKLRRK